ncbi:PH domain-containing protein [Corynebacterium sp. NML130628]|uniref:PH domain-containing protein n=1 Tax=Corynebacterium sp. NML130628 TaxID=1906333 RepID=UPI0008FB3487|nr:PH domain-containing protein [Corynebacterium sp. NML130628]OIR40254.1 hypothetical protein BJP07_09880 [Corynebacterium sp. NML130628]
MTAAPEYRRVHRLTPLLRVWATLLALLTIAVFNFTVPLMNWLQDEGVGIMDVGVAVGVFIVGLLVVFVISQLWWAKIGFRVGDEDIELKRGVLTTTVRTARYDRIQAVDVIEPFAPRLFGLAAVRVEAAGGNNSAIEIAYLPRAEADELRAEILRAIAARPGAAAPALTRAEQDSDPANTLVPPIPIGRSLLAAAFQLSTIITVVSSAVPLFTDLSITAALPILVGFVPQIWRTIDHSWRFNSVLDDATSGSNGAVINMTYGLANRRRQAVPLHRIHAIQLRQPLLWRAFGWWTVSVTVAGYGSERNKATGTSKLLPVGTLEQAMRVIDAIAPLSGEAMRDMSRAQLRSPGVARWVSPVDWRRQTVTLYPEVTVVTFGRLSKRYQMVENTHIQELSFKQGPLQHMLGLAHVRFDLVPGAVKMVARDLRAGEGRWLVDTLRTRTLPPMTTESELDSAGESQLPPGLEDSDGSGVGKVH